MSPNVSAKMTPSIGSRERGSPPTTSRGAMSERSDTASRIFPNRSSSESVTVEADENASDAERNTIPTFGAAAVTERIDSRGTSFTSDGGRSGVLSITCFKTGPTNDAASVSNPYVTRGSPSLSRDTT